MDRNEVFEIVKRNILDVLPDLSPDMIRGEQRLADLGANSVDRMEIITLCMADLGLDIPLLSFAGAPRIADLADVLAGNAQ
ncbi:acyl carrier protein [Xanthomonas campestris pv. fici]|uniref:acyl carrier protein n=1 Tax=Xanthomonas euvesicatoria TaxID=456327 RepID=UPI003558D408